MPDFELKPFHSDKTPNITITGNIKRTGDQLFIRYKVSGDIDQIIFPAPSNSPSRKDDLWKATCFEIFIAVPDQPKYREFNMSPSGDWNVYKIDSYRQVNMRKETAFTQLPFEFKLTKTNFSLNISINLEPIIQAHQNLQIGITTIVQTKDGHETYWALKHPGPQADFHTRESFVLYL